MDTIYYHPTLSRRIKACIIDGVISPFITILLGYIVFDVFNTPNNLLSSILICSPIFLIEPLFIAKFGATIGHYLLRLEVITILTDKPPTFHVAFFRYLCKLATGFISVIMVIIDDEQKTIHDYLFSTEVIFNVEKINKNPNLIKLAKRKQIPLIGSPEPSKLKHKFLSAMWFWILYIVEFLFLLPIVIMLESNFIEQPLKYLFIIFFIPNLILSNELAKDEQL